MEENTAKMSAAEAKEHILALATTLKLTEKKINSLEAEKAKWKGRIELAQSKGMSDLAEGAVKEAQRIEAEINQLSEEVKTYKDEIENFRRQLPALAARERSIDPDLLEQELAMILGRSSEEAETEKAFQELEKSAAADADLDALKAKLNKTQGSGENS